MSSFRGHEYLAYICMGFTVAQISKIFNVPKSEVLAQTYWWQSKLKKDLEIYKEQLNGK